MSKGPGRIERAILAAVAAEPEKAFTVLDLVDRIWPDRALPVSCYRGTEVSNEDRAEKKQRVTVARAMRTAVARSGGQLSLFRWDRTVALYRTYDVLSYAMARMKSDPLYRYRSPDLRHYFHRGIVTTEADLRANLAPGGREHANVVEGGVWFEHIRHAVALRDGDTAAAAACEAAAAAERDAAMEGLKGALAKRA
jgi:hypothetical protein